MKNFILTVFTCIGIMTVSTVTVALIATIINDVISKRKKRKLSSDDKNDKSNDQSIESLTIEATNDKQYVDEALADCDNLINYIKACEKQNKSSKEVEIIDEQIHKYRLLMSFDIDSDSQEINFNEYAEKYNYNHSIFKTYSTKELLVIQTFALKIFEYMFPNDLKPYSRGRNGICEMQFVHDKKLNKYVLKIEYIYRSSSVDFNYPILDGYYFGCMVGSQILISELLDMVDEMERVLNIDSLSSLTVKNHIKSVFARMRTAINAKKFPQFSNNE